MELLMYTIAVLGVNAFLGSINNCFENFELLQLHYQTGPDGFFSTLWQVIDGGIKKQKKKLPGAFSAELGNTLLNLPIKTSFSFSVGTVSRVVSKQAQEGIYQIATLLAKHFKIPESEMKSKSGLLLGFYSRDGAILLNRKNGDGLDHSRSSLDS